MIEIVVVLIILALIFWSVYDKIKKEGERNLDHRGYYRNGYGRLVHRDTAFKCLYSYPKYSKRFRDYDIHHKDRNKLNNSPDNLEILTREEHNEKHKKRSKWEYGTHHNKENPKITKGAKNKREAEEKRIREII